MPCMCGACDCPSCGPAQGYDVVRVGKRWVLAEDLEDDEEDDEPEPEPEIVLEPARFATTGGWKADSLRWEFYVGAEPSAAIDAPSFIPCGSVRAIDAYLVTTVARAA